MKMSVITISLLVLNFVRVTIVDPAASVMNMHAPTPVHATTTVPMDVLIVLITFAANVKLFSATRNLDRSKEIFSEQFRNLKKVTLSFLIFFSNQSQILNHLTNRYS